MVGPTGDLVVHGSRAKSIGIAVLGLVMGLLGVWLIRTGDPQNFSVVVGGWSSAVLFPLAAVVAVLNAINPPTLILSDEGFRIRRLLFPSRLVPWRDVGRFFLWGMGATKMVAFNYEDGREPGDLMTRLNSGLGAPGNIGTNWMMEPEALLGELARRHAAATQPEMRR